MIYNILIGAVVLYLLVVITNYIFDIRRDNKLYYQGSSLVYWPKWLYYCFLIKIDQLSRRHRLNNYDKNYFLYETCGVVPTESECKLESPKNLLTARHEDGMLLWGGDDKNRFIVAKIIRQSDRRANVMLIIRDEDGSLYTIPNQPDSNVYNVANEDKWIGSGLLLECIEPMRTWRLKYNGFLRRGVREEYVTDDAMDDDDDKNTPIYHARVDFLWKAMRAPVDVWPQSSAKLLADALARKSGLDSSLFRSLDRDGYDQMGVLHGTLSIDSKQQQWYLRGCRQHRWGMSDSSTNLNKCINLFAFLETGDFCFIEAFSYDSGLTHCVMGYSQTASGRYQPVTSTSLDLANLSTNPEKKVAKNMHVEFQVSNSKHIYWHHLLDEGCLIHTGDPWTLRHSIHPTYVASKDSQGWGLIIMTNKFRGLCPVPERESIEINTNLVPHSANMPFVVPINSDECKLSSLTGGKASSLAYLCQIRQDDIETQFSVPKGVVVTNIAWNNEVRKNLDLRSALNLLENAVVSSQQSLVKEACQKMVELMDEIDLSDEVMNYLVEKLNLLFPNGLQNLRFAVRSSACCEDSEDASAAGQNDTFLGCVWEDWPVNEKLHSASTQSEVFSGFETTEQINDDGLTKESCGNINTNKLDEFSSIITVKKALMACWASQFTYRSVEYRRQWGQPLNGGMGVVVQVMVPADFAGIIFTRDPVSGNPGIISISANYGLGETVVSGAIEPDTMEIRRTWRNKLEIKSKRIGDKKIKSVMAVEGSTLEIKLDAKDSSKMCLTDRLALKIAKISIDIENNFGSPRDIEFAIQGNGVYILQARPITSLYEWTDYEITHEFDSPILSEEEIHTVANTGEVFPGYSTPLTISTIVKCLDLSLQRRFCLLEYPHYKYDASLNRLMAVAFFKPLLNLGEMFFRGNQREVSMSNYSLDLGILGHLFTTTEIHSWAKRRYGVMSLFSFIKRIYPQIYDIFSNGGRLRSYSSHFSNYSIECGRAHSAAALYEKICTNIPDQLQIFSLHVKTSGVSTMAQTIAMVTVLEGAKAVTDELIQDIALLFASISETESADVPTAIKSLAREICSTSDATDFVTMSTDEARVWLESDPGASGKKFRQFVEKHGHRCIKEFDYRSLSWGLSSTSLVSALQQMVKNPESLRYERKKEKNLIEVLDKLRTPIKKNTKRVLRLILKLCGRAVNHRETSKSLSIKVVDAFRRAYRALGLLLVSECRLPDADLIFFMQHGEVGQLIATRSPVYINKALKRRKLMKTIENLVLDEVSFGVPQPVNLDEGSEEREVGDGSMVLKGTPVCHGTAKGTARIVTKLEDAHLIQNEDILVTYSTDVGWTPYFPLLGGVITEIGGLISHGAVVAREYGLPCVVGVKGATRILNSGDSLILNGGEGTVEKMKKINS